MNSEPAFPTVPANFGTHESRVCSEGMTLRNYFAAHALIAIFPMEGGTHESDAVAAYKAADAMLVASAPKSELATTDEIKFLRDLLRRIAIEYPAVAGPNECPPAPHGCPKCEIHFLLAEFAESEAPKC